MDKASAPVFPPQPLLLWPLVTLGILAISIASILIRSADAPPLTIATYRVSLAALCIAPFFAHRHGAMKSVWTPKVLAATVLSGSFLAFHFVFWIHSLQMTSIASSVTLVSTTPLFVALFSSLALHEHAGRAILFGIGCTMLGSGLVAGTDFAFSAEALRGDLLALLGALMAAGYLLAGRVARRSLDLTAYTFGAYTTAGLILLACSLGTHTPLTGFSRTTTLILILLALIPQLIGHTTFNWTLKFLPPATVAVLILGEPLGATLLAFLIFGETLSLFKTLGLLILASGIVWSARAIPCSGTSG